MIASFELDFYDILVVNICDTCQTTNSGQISREKVSEIPNDIITLIDLRSAKSHANKGLNKM